MIAIGGNGRYNTHVNLSDINSFIPLIAAGCYTILLVVTLFKRSQQNKQRRWFLGLIAISLLWEFSFVFVTTLPYKNLSLKSLLLNTLILAILTAVYIEWAPRRRWVLLVETAVIIILFIDFFVPQLALPVLPNSAWEQFTFATLILYSSWAIFSSIILIKSWLSYKRSTLPWHANRLLFWSITLSFILLGELLQFISLSNLVIIGQTVRLLGFISLSYAVFSYRIFDVRTNSRRGFAFLIINTISALPLIGAILLVQQLDTKLDDVEIGILITIIITLSFFFYQPFRDFVYRNAYRYIFGEDVSTNLVVRNYSQAISQTVDVQQLSTLIIGTLNELLETNRGALYLITKLENENYEIDPIPGMGKISRQQFHMRKNSPVIKTIMGQHQPLLQYDLDFNPDFNILEKGTRQWLKSQSMEAFVPIMAEQEISGLIAIGPKKTAVPYQPNELDLVQILADQTVVALQNARLFSELGDQNEQISDLYQDLLEQNERLEIMDRVKSDFITIASHELRTPLTQVKGYTDILDAMNEENALTREQTREIIGHVNRATVQLESLITAMLDASQLDVDGMQLTFVKTQLDTILKLAAEPLIHAMKERSIKLTLNGIEELPPIHADFKRLVQAFSNILGNAVKYTPDHGSITVTAVLAPINTQTDQEFLEISISDTGIGIDPKFHDLIFEKFFRIGDPQLHSTGSTKFKGAGPGLGLPIAKGVIEAHGGRIWVESDGEDEASLSGSRFHIVMPTRPQGSELAVQKETERPSWLIG